MPRTVPPSMLKNKKVDGLIDKRAIEDYWDYYNYPSAFIFRASRNNPGYSGRRRCWSISAIIVRYASRPID